MKDPWGKEMAPDIRDQSNHNLGRKIPLTLQELRESPYFLDYKESPPSHTGAEIV